MHYINDTLKPFTAVLAWGKCLWKLFLQELPNVSSRVTSFEKTKSQLWINACWAWVDQSVCSLVSADNSSSRRIKEKTS